MNLISGDKYQRKFEALLGELNKHHKNKKKYDNITVKICFLVGNMIGHIDSLEVERRDIGGIK